MGTLKHTIIMQLNSTIQEYINVINDCGLVQFTITTPTKQTLQTSMTVIDCLRCFFIEQLKVMELGGIHQYESN